MASNRNKHQSADDFETYRQIAPEVFSDDSLRILIKSKNNNREAILAAIENIWHDTPDQQAVGSEWVAASKKKEVPPPAKPSTRQGDTGGRGGGRSRQTAGGRGNGDSRGERNTRNVNKTPSPATVSSPAPAEVSTETTEPVAPAVRPAATVAPAANAIRSAAPVSAPAAAVAHAPAPVASTAAASGKPAWGSGVSFVEKMKINEAEKEKEKAKAAATAAAAALAAAQAAQEVKENVVVENAEPESSNDAAVNKKSTRTRNARKNKSGSKKSTDSEVAESSSPGEDPKSESVVSGVGAIHITESESAASAESPVAAENTDNGSFLKLGKWEAPVASAEMFQFGSFGSFNEEEVGKNAWGKSAEETVSSVVQEESVWSSSADQVNSASSQALGSLFASKMPPGIDAPASATRAPPGLEQNQAAKQQGNNNLRGVAGNQNKFNKDFQQSQQQQILMQQPILYPQQYSQPLPPGIAPVVGNRNAVGASTGATAYPAYNPTFDLSQPQFLHPNYNASAAAPSLPTASSTGTAAAPALTQGAPASANTASIQQQQQQQQYGAPFPFYGNPYYNQYYYGQAQVPPNFYNQNGRNVYQQQQQRPYGSDPYANSGSLYPDMYQGAGQFPDAYGSVQQTNNSSNTAVGSNASGNKAGKSVASGNSAAVPQDHNAAHLGNYMNYGYNNRLDPQAQAWGYQQNAAQWGAPVMFPNAAPATGSNQGFVQQAPHLGMTNISTQQQPPANAQRQQGGNYSTSLAGNRNAGVNGTPNTAQGGW